MSKQKFSQVSPPTLLGSISDDSTPSMLSSLDGEASKLRKTKHGRSPVWIGGTALLLTGIVIGGGFLIASNVTASIKPAHVPVSHLVAAGIPKATSMADEKISMDDAPASQAATIITDQPSQDQKPQYLVKSSDDPHDRLSAALDGSPLIPQSTSNQSNKPKSVKKEKTSKSAKKEKSHHQSTHKSKSKHHHPNENDVKLLAALVASTNQDIVERKPGDTTASLLKRCEMLGYQEGTLCSKRICSGQWKNDPACIAIEKEKTASSDNKDK